jgi:hypothetical protein
MSPRWIKCPFCANFWCWVHQKHVHDCECPPIEEMTFDPYATSAEEE